MRFRKRMNPIIKKFNGLDYEATDWYRTREGAERQKKFLENIGFVIEILFEPSWPGYFVYVGSPEYRRLQVLGGTKDG